MRNLIFVCSVILAGKLSFAQTDYKLSINYGYNSDDKSIEVTVYNNTWEGEHQKLVYYPVALLLDEAGDTIKVSDDRYYGIGDMSTFRFPLEEELKEDKIIQFKLYSIRFERLYEEWTFKISPDRNFSALEPISEEPVEDVIFEDGEKDLDNLTLTHKFHHRVYALHLTINSEKVQGFVSYPSLQVLDVHGTIIGEHQFDTYGLSGEDHFEIQLNPDIILPAKVTVALSEGHSIIPIKTWDIELFAK